MHSNLYARQKNLLENFTKTLLQGYFILRQLMVKDGSGGTFTNILEPKQSQNGIVTGKAFTTQSKVKI